MGLKAPNGRVNIEVSSGSDLDRAFTWRRGNASLVNLTGGTATLTVETADGATVLELTEGAGITLGGTAGTIVVHVDAAETAALDVTGDRPHAYALEVTIPQEGTYRIASGRFEVVDGADVGTGLELIVETKDVILELSRGPASLLSRVTGPLADGAVPTYDETTGGFVLDAAGASGLADHVADTTAVHGIADTAAVETTVGAQEKADDAQNAAQAYADTAVGTALAGLSLNDVSDVDDAAAASGDGLVWDGDSWSPAAVVPKALFDANTVLAANADDTPAALSMAPSTILSRLAAGNIKAASVAEIKTLLGPAFPGYQFNYVERTTNLSVTASTEVTSDVFITANEVTYDGSTAIMVEFFVPYFDMAPTQTMVVSLFDGSTQVSRLVAAGIVTTSAMIFPGGLYCTVLTPSAGAHTYSIRAFRAIGSGAQTLAAGARGTSTYGPAFLRQVRVS